MKTSAGCVFAAVAAAMLVGCAGQMGQYPMQMPPAQPMATWQPVPAAPPLPAPAAQPFIYPSRGQSPQQEEFDKGQCYSWAVQQSGFDPANPRVAMAPPPSPRAPQGGMLRGAAGGAALGAVGGAIGGDAGKGAAIGAGVGALFGAMRRARWMEEEQQQQQANMAQQEGALAHGRGNYNRAFSVCMTGCGYTVSM